MAADTKKTINAATTNLKLLSAADINASSICKNTLQKQTYDNH
jgi:hypothetical protein